VEADDRLVLARLDRVEPLLERPPVDLALLRHEGGIRQVEEFELDGVGRGVLGVVPEDEAGAGLDVGDPALQGAGLEFLLGRGEQEQQEPH
jgi:hypothetical protein